MNNSRQVIPIAGLVASIAISIYMVVQLHAQVAAGVGDLSTAALAEVHDAQGQLLLRGQFLAVENEDDDGDVERKARLEPAGSDADATGEAEVEISSDGSSPQEVEFSVRNLEPSIMVTFLIDGQEISRATVDRRGRAEVELDIARPGAATSR